MAAGSANTAKFYYKPNSSTAVDAADLVGDLVAISDFTIEGATIDVSTLGANAYREFLGGKYQATFTVEVFWNQSAHAAIFTALTARTIGTFELDFQNGQVTGSAMVTSANITASIDDAVRSSISFQVTGAVTVAATTAGPATP
ncbi:MAG: phage tail tube protein [Synechococcus sp.]|nr:phage tail tube protein [Synechococcus sp.]